MVQPLLHQEQLVSVPAGATFTTLTANTSSLMLVLPQRGRHNTAGGLLGTRRNNYDSTSWHAAGLQHSHQLSEVSGS